MSIRWLLPAVLAAALVAPVLAHAALIKNGTARLGKVIRDAGIHAE